MVATRGAIVVVAAAIPAATDSARAGASSGCAAINAGALNGEIQAAGNVTRQLTLEAGDIVNLSVRGAQGATSSITLINGTGAPRTLIGNSSAATVSFRAPQTDTYAFRFDSAPGGSAAVGLSCTSAQVAGTNAAFLARRRDLLNAKGPDRLRIDRAPTPIANPDKPLSSSVAVDGQGNPKQLEFSVSLSEIFGGYLGFDEFSTLNPMITTDSAADLHLKAEAGVAMGVKEGSTLQATGGVESGNDTTPENWMGRLQLNVPLGK